MKESTARPRRSGLAWGFIAVALVCAYMLVGWLAVQAMIRAADRQARHTELSQARARWEAQSIPTYRLSIQIESAKGFACTMAFEVHAQSQTQLVRDNCGMLNDSNRLEFVDTHGTVPALFDYIAGEIDQWGGCGPNGCACDGRRIVDVQYDPDHGYPQRFTARYQQDWTTRRMLHGCSLMGFSEPSPFTVAVTPIE